MNPPVWLSKHSTVPGKKEKMASCGGPKDNSGPVPVCVSMCVCLSMCVHNSYPSCPATLKISVNFGRGVEPAEECFHVAT